jgi:hypothetical protein
MQGLCLQSPSNRAIERQATQQTGTDEMHQTGASMQKLVHAFV